MKFYLRTDFGELKDSYPGTIIHPFQGLCQGNGGAPEGWFMIIYIIIIYVENKGHGVEIKISTNRDYFKLVTMVLINDGNFRLWLR